MLKNRIILKIPALCTRGVITVFDKIVRVAQYQYTSSIYEFFKSRRCFDVDGCTSYTYIPPKQMCLAVVSRRDGCFGKNTTQQSNEIFFLGCYDLITFTYDVSFVVPATINPIILTHILTGPDAESTIRNGEFVNTSTPPAITDLLPTSILAGVVLPYKDERCGNSQVFSVKVDFFLWYPKGELQ